MSREPEQNAVESVPEGKYVYCILETSKPRSFGPMGIGGRGDDVYTIYHKGLAAVVSNTPLVVYEPTRENVFAHEQVNETVMREFTVLPMAFGALFKTDDDIIELIRGTYDALRDVLAKMEGKVEFGLKVNWDRDKVTAELEQKDDEIRHLKEQITSKTTGSNYFAGMQLGRLIETALTDQADSYIREVYSLLRDTTPLPFRFGTLVTRKGLDSYITSRRPALKERLFAVQNCEELSFKIIWPKWSERQQAVQLNSQPDESGPGASFLKSKREELFGDQQLAGEAKEISEWLRSRLARLVRKEQVSVEPKQELMLSTGYLVIELMRPIFVQN